MTRPERPAGAGTAALAALGLCASAPPAWFPGAEFAVLLGLAALFRVAVGSARPYRLAYAIGVLHVAWFSWSLWFVTPGGYVAIALLGGLYYVAAVAWTRACRARSLAWLGFGLGIAATMWLRAHMPEVAYPHGQVAHAWYRWPALLGPVRWGGELLANGLLAICAAGLAIRLPGSRLPGSRLPRSRPVALVAGAVWALLCVVSPPAAAGSADAAASLRVAAFESRFPVRFAADPQPPFTALLQATREVATSASPPELLLWPESAWPARLEGDPPRLSRAFAPPIEAPARLCAGTVWRGHRGRLGVAVLIDADGALIDWHEKRVTVPAGERVPFVRWLPEALAEWLFDWMEPVVGFRPDAIDGLRRPPLRTASGVPFAALTCFDNAFAAVAADAVEDGARLVAVLSNESWYRQGNELEQMLAMTVFRALETDTPFVRSTVDGLTCVVDRLGRVDALPILGVGPPRALVRDVELGAGSLPRWQRLHAALAVVALLSGLWVLAVHLRGLLRRMRGSRS